MKNRRTEGEGGGGGAEVVGNAARKRCGHGIAIIREYERMMAVIVTACSAFGLTVSEAKPDMMCLQTKAEGRYRLQ